MEEKCPVVNNFEMNSPVYGQQGSQVEGQTLLSLPTITGVFVFLLDEAQCSVQGESRALRQETVGHATLVNL